MERNIRVNWCVILFIVIDFGLNAGVVCVWMGKKRYGSDPKEPRKRKRSKKTHKHFGFCLGKIRSISHLECIQWLVCCDSREWSVSNVSYSSRCDCNTNAHQFRLLDAPSALSDCYYTKSNDPVEKIAIY